MDKNKYIKRESYLNKLVIRRDNVTVSAIRYHYSA